MKKKAVVFKFILPPISCFSSFKRVWKGFYLLLMDAERFQFCEYGNFRSVAILTCNILLHSAHWAPSGLRSEYSQTYFFEATYLRSC